MATWNTPALPNLISVDIPALQQLLLSLTKMDPSAHEDVVAGAIRCVAVATGVYQFQAYDGSAWAKLPTLNMSVTHVNDYTTSTTATASTIAVRNVDGKLAGDLTGNAATATSAQALSVTNPIAKGGTGATTAAGARTNLAVPPTSHASTASTYGMSTATNYGHNKLSDAVDSTLTAATGGTAASPAAVKTAYDKAAEAQETANSKWTKVVASETIPGIVERATDAEAREGVDESTYVTPAHLGFVADEARNATRAMNTNAAQYIIDNPDIRYGVQSFCVSANDPDKIYALYLTVSSLVQYSTVAKFARRSRMTVPVSQSEGDGTTIGHQGLFCIDADGDDRLVSTGYSDKRKVVFATYVADAEFSDVTTFTAFDSSFTASLSCTPSLSRDRKSYIVQGSKDGERYFREYRITDNTLLTETIIDESVLASKSVQGMALDGQTIYVVAGDNSLSRNKLFLKIKTTTGEILYKTHRYSAFFETAVGVGSSVYEPEGMTWIDDDLCMGVVTGVSSTNRRTAILNLTSPSNGIGSTLLGNILSNITSASGEGREYLALRAGNNLDEGAGLNIYGSNDTTERNVTFFKRDGSGASAASFGDNFLEGPYGDQFSVSSRGELRLLASDEQVIRLMTDGATTATLSSEDVVLFKPTTLRATTNNYMDIGDSLRRMKSIYLVNAPSTTSDRNLKQDIADIDNTVLEAWGLVKWQVFRLRESFAAKGEAARKHIGVIAQDIITAFASKGLDAFDYALVRRVSWDSQEAVFDGGIKVTDAIEAGERLEVVYEEALALECAYMRYKLNLSDGGEENAVSCGA